MVDPLAVLVDEEGALEVELDTLVVVVPLLTTLVEIPLDVKVDGVGEAVVGAGAGVELSEEGAGTLDSGAGVPTTDALDSGAGAAVGVVAMTAVVDGVTTGTTTDAIPVSYSA